MSPIIDWTRVDLVMLDMDGTVLDLAFDNYLWRKAVPERYAQRRGITAQQATAELAPRFEAVMHTLPWYDTDYWTSLTGVNVAALHVELKDRIGMLDGSQIFLDAMREQGRPMWLTTNAHPDSWRPKLDTTRTRHYYDRIISSYDIGAPKEDQAFWKTMQREHSFDPSRCLFADDSQPVLDAAREFGIGQVVAMHAPDTSAPNKQFTGGYPSVARLNELLPT